MNPVNFHVENCSEFIPIYGGHWLHLQAGILRGDINVNCISACQFCSEMCAISNV